MRGEWISTTDCRDNGILDICDHIIVGEITEAISALRLQFPSVLDTTRPRTKANTNGNSTNGNSENQTHPTTTEMERASPESPPRSLPSSPELPPLRSLPGHVTSDKGSVRNSTNGSTNGSTSSIPLFPYHDVYDRPDFLSINLEIQQFVESLRHMVIPSSPSSMASSIHSDSPFVGAGSSANGTGTGTGVGGGKSTGSLLGQMPGRDTSILHALNRAQSLHATAKSLSPQESRAYLKEIENVCALLAYTDMEGSPLRGYLDQGRRIALAEQVNGSILGERSRGGSSFPRRDSSLILTGHRCPLEKLKKSIPANRHTHYSRCPSSRLPSYGS